MAAMAQRDQENRQIEVSREKLIETLVANREKHILEYEEAKAGYKAVLDKKIDEAAVSARLKLERQYEEAKRHVAGLTDADIEDQRDSITLLDAFYVEMKVPRCFKKEYDAAIDMAKWDVRDTLVLTYAEFTCFVRDQWDWKRGFEAISAIYKSK